MRGSVSILVRWVVLIAFAGLVMYGSLRPIAPGLMPEVPHIDKVLHFVAYAVMTMLAFRALWADDARPVSLVALAIGVGLVTAYGAGMEIFQGFTPDREFSWLDMIANGAGAALAAAVWEPLTERFRWMR